MIGNISWAEGPWIIIGVLACIYCFIWLRKTVQDVYYHITEKINGVQLYASYTMFIIALFITTVEILFTIAGIVAGFSNTTGGSNAVTPNRFAIIGCLILGQCVLALLSFVINHRYDRLVELAKMYAAQELLEEENVSPGQTRVTEGGITRVTIES